MSTADSHPWRVCGTSATVESEVDLEAFETTQLLQELIDRKVLTKDTAYRIDVESRTGGTWGDDLLASARREILVGRRHEALILIERLLGSDWIGRLA